jgi:hypothetical protein
VLKYRDNKKTAQSSYAHSLHPQDGRRVSVCSFPFLQGKCYNGVCQPGFKTYEVKNISANLTVLARYPFAQEWHWGRIFRAGFAVGQIVPLAGEVGRTSPANVTSAVVTGAPLDPRTGSPISTGLMMLNPTSSDRVEAQVWYTNATADHPAGVFNGMKVRSRSCTARRILFPVSDPVCLYLFIVASTLLYAD